MFELVAERKRGIDERNKLDRCARFEMLIAARDEGTIGGTAGAYLDAHLRECADCQAVAATMAPASERRGQVSLPPVSTSAYALGREVARGGMGRILAANDLRIGRPVAVKELLGKNPGLAARFEREARVTARLQHPGIIPIYEIGTWPDGTPFYAMRMVEGDTLRDAIRSKQNLDERLGLLPAVIAAAEAVAYAHGNSIIHRDLTPNNILVGAHGDTVVIDWGLAKDLSAAAPEEESNLGPFRDEAVDLNLTNVGAVIGTAAYMPPEQARGTIVATPADVYALGAILYHLLAGDAPYGSNTSVQDVIAAAPRPIADVAPGAPRDLVSIVVKAMQRDAADRYSSAKELAEELRRFQTGRLVEAHHYSRSERIRRWTRLHRGFVIGMTSALVALVAIGTVAFASVLAARNRSERQRAIANQVNAELLEEQGRQALLQDSPGRAAVWLSASYGAGNDRSSLRTLLGLAMQSVESIEHQLDCEVAPSGLDLIGDEISSIAASPDHQLVAVSCGTWAQIWRLQDGVRLFKLTAKGADFRGIAFSPDGAHVMTGGHDGVARLWNTRTGVLEHELVGHSAKLSTELFTADSRLAITASFDRTIRIWDVSTGTLIRLIQAADAQQVGVRAYLVAGRLLSTSTDGQIREWDVATGKQVSVIENKFQITDLEEISGHRIVACGLDSVATVWDLDTRQQTQRFAGHSANLWGCIVTPDRQKLVTTSNDRTAKIWDIESGRLLSTLQHEAFVGGAALSSDGRTLVTSDGRVNVWDVATGMRLGTDDVAIPGEVAIVGDRILAASGSKVNVYRNLDKSRHVFTAPAGSTIELTSHDGTRAVVSDPDGEITIWDLQRGVKLEHEPLRKPVVGSMDRLVARDISGVVIVDMRTGRAETRLPVREPGAFELGNDARYLLVQRERAQSDVWDVARKTIVQSWPADDMPVGLETGLDRLVVITKHDGAELWALDSPRILARLSVDRTTSASATFFDDRVIVQTTNGFPSIVQLFDASSGRELKTYPGALGWGIARNSTAFAVKTSTSIRFVDIPTGNETSELPWGLVIGEMGVARSGSIIAAAEATKSLIEVFDVSGRVLVEFPYRGTTEYTEDSFHVGAPQVRFSTDGTRLIVHSKTGTTTVELPFETRSPQVIAQTLATRVPLRVADGHLMLDRGAPALIRGRVTRDGKAIAGATVTISEADGYTLLRTTTDAVGRYEIASLTARRMQVSAQSVIANAFARPRPVSLVEGDNTSDIELDLAGTISGRLIDSHGKPIPGEHVRAECKTCGSEDSGEASTATDGSFTIGMLSGGGVYELGAESHPGRLQVPVIDGNDHVVGVSFMVTE
ncbi:MAG: protein kinase [Kofleriaceae bacterium]